MDKPVPIYGLLLINDAYNEGKITFKEWLELSREWALAMKRQFQEHSAEPDLHTSQSA